MKSNMQAWMVIAVLGATMAYAVAEDITLTTYYPSPRGVYQAVRIGNGVIPPPPNKSAHLHIMQSNPALLSFRVDHTAGGTNPVVIDQSGRLGIGVANPAQPLVVNGNALILAPGTITIQSGLPDPDPTITTDGPPDHGKVLTAINTNGDTTWDYPRYAP